MDQHQTITPAVYQQLLRELLPKAAGVARAMVRNRSDAEDMVQEAALKGYRSLDEYDGRRPFKSWFFTILRNCCRDLLRRRASSNVALADMDSLDARSGDVELWEELAAAMQRLSVAHRQVLELRYFGESSYREIAAALGIPEGTVMSRLHAARQALAEIYCREAT